MVLTRVVPEKHWTQSQIMLRIKAGMGWIGKRACKRLESWALHPHPQITARDLLSVEKSATFLKTAVLREGTELRSVRTPTVNIRKTQTRKAMWVPGREARGTSSLLWPAHHKLGGWKQHMDYEGQQGGGRYFQGDVTGDSGFHLACLLLLLYSEGRQLPGCELLCPEVHDE